MADSNITKKALAEAMKKLMSEKQFSKITVGDICELCDMNRKSFYYHFKDKYDLVNWIFDIEFISVIRKKSYNDSWDVLKALFLYFEQNKEFYKKALSVDDYNSFREHFRKLLSDIFLPRIDIILANEDIELRKKTFCINVLSDGFIAATERWLTGKENISAEEFCEYLQFILQKVGTKYGQKAP